MMAYSRGRGERSIGLVSESSMLHGGTLFVRLCRVACIYGVFFWSLLQYCGFSIEFFTTHWRGREVARCRLVAFEAYRD